MKLLRKLQKFTVWNFYRDRHLHHQTLKGSRVGKETHCTNVFRMHLCTCVCACFSLPVSGSKGECYLDQNPNCFTETRTRQDLHSVLTSDSLASIKKGKGARNWLRRQDRRELKLLEETVWLVQTWEMQALCPVTSSDLFLFWGWRKLERSVIFPWGRFNQRFSSEGWTSAA